MIIMFINDYYFFFYCGILCKNNEWKDYWLFSVNVIIFMCWVIDKNELKGFGLINYICDIYCKWE